MYNVTKKKLFVALFVLLLAQTFYVIENVFFFMRDEMSTIGSVIAGISGCCTVVWIIIPPLYLGTLILKF